MPAASAGVIAPWHAEASVRPDSHSHDVYASQKSVAVSAATDWVSTTAPPSSSSLQLGSASARSDATIQGFFMFMSIDSIYGGDHPSRRLGVCASGPPRD